MRTLGRHSCSPPCCSKRGVAPELLPLLAEPARNAVQVCVSVYAAAANELQRVLLVSLSWHAR